MKKPSILSRLKKPGIILTSIGLGSLPLFVMFYLFSVDYKNIFTSQDNSGFDQTVFMTMSFIFLSIGLVLILIGACFWGTSSRNYDFPKCKKIGMIISIIAMAILAISASLFIWEARKTNGINSQGLICLSIACLFIATLIPSSFFWAIGDKYSDKKIKKSGK